MKKALLALAVVGVAAAAFSQGKVSLQLDGGSAITIQGDPRYYFPADAAFAGQQVPTTGPLPSGHILEVGLYGGTSSTSLSLQGSVLLNPVGGTGQSPGVIPVTHITLRGIPGATAAAYFQVRIWDASYASYEACAAAILVGATAYMGENYIFTMTPGTFTYNAINTGGGTTWAAVGNESTTAFNLTAYDPRFPEPSAFALAALGAATWLLRRRGKG